MIGVDPRPSSVARRSASSPWRRPSAKAPRRSGLRQTRPGLEPQRLYWACQTPGPQPPRSAAAARPPGRNRPWPDAAPGMGCLHLQGAIAELSREIEGLLARRNGAVVVSRPPELTGHLGQHPYQPGPSSSALARTSASPNRARHRPYSPRAFSERPKARRRSMASTLVSPSSGR